MANVSHSVRGRGREWQVLSGAPLVAVVSVAFVCVVLSARRCPESCCPARRLRPSMHLFGFTRRPRKITRPDAGRAAQSTKKLDLHAKFGLNASTVCVFSLEQSAYSKQIAEDRKDTNSTYLTPEGATPCSQEKQGLFCWVFLQQYRARTVRFLLPRSFEIRGQTH